MWVYKTGALVIPCLGATGNLLAIESQRANLLEDITVCQKLHPEVLGLPSTVGGPIHQVHLVR